MPIIGGAALFSAAAGYFVRGHGKALAEQLETTKAELLKTRDKDRRDVLIADQDRLENRSELGLAAGWSLMYFAVAFAVMALALGLKVKPRRAILALAPALLLSALHFVYNVGIVSMSVSGLLAVALIWYITGERDPRVAREIDEFRHFPTRREIEPEIGESSFRSIAEQAREIEQQKLLRGVPLLPPTFARMLPTVGEGRPVVYLQLLEDLSYVAFVEADAYNVSDYMTVLMLLEEPAHSFVARPLPLLDGVRIANTGLTFKDDPEFSQQYLVEVDPGRDPRAVRAFLSPVVRAELSSLPAVWLHVNGNVMALTIFGRFDAETADHLVDMADVLFAEYGADGGPSLLDPDGAEVVGEPVPVKKKKKKKSKPAFSASPGA